MPDKDKAIQAN